MKTLFIDANIYLSFYNSNRPELKKLLNALTEKNESIFFTRQIANEIDRNKLNVLQASFANYIKQVALNKTILPEHLDQGSPARLLAWNQERKTLETSINKSNEELPSILKEILTEISTSTDFVSNSLEILYKKAKDPSLDELNRARIRKETGNPPGKKEDPLGDQLSWEQLLSISSNITDLWIISQDKDYYTEYNKEMFLNPVLLKDLKLRNPKINIKVFNLLSEALRDFNKSEKIKSIPSSQELDKIAKDEARSLSRPIIPEYCINCSTFQPRIGPFYIRSQLGGITEQYLCPNCHYKYDTGEEYD